VFQTPLSSYFLCFSFPLFYHYILHLIPVFFSIPPFSIPAFQTGPKARCGLLFSRKTQERNIASENITNEICKLRVNLNYKQNNSSLVPHVFFFSSSIFIENLPHVFFYVLSNLHTSLFFPFFFDVLFDLQCVVLGVFLPSSPLA
jgi:hypothetical protein